MSGADKETWDEPIDDELLIAQQQAAAPRIERAIVALVGRPNVGKSTLFNRLMRKKTAIVEDIPGVTRDRHYGDAVLGERPVLLIDTGGFEPKTDDEMLLAMRRQTELAIEEAEAVVLVADGAAGLRPEDKEIARRLRKAGKPFVVAVNKIDHERHEANVPEFHQLGAEQLISVSAEHGRGHDELITAIMTRLGPPKPAAWAEEGVRASIAVIGRPNVGKSSLLNLLLGEERHLATPIAGTTRDSIDSFIEKGEHRYRFIDTAGLRRKARISERLEEFMVVSTLRSLESADLVVLMLDATEPFTDQDAKIAALAHDRGKGIVLVVNKWDLPHERLTSKNLIDEINHTLPFMSYARVLYMSVKTKHGVDQLFEQIEGAIAEREKRIPTGELNRLVSRMYEEHEPAYHAGKRGKIYFATQVQIKPPTFVFSVNDPDRFTDDYARYLTNQFRKHMGFEGTPLVIRFRRRHKSDEGSGVEHKRDEHAIRKSKVVAAKKSLRGGSGTRPSGKGGTGKKGQGRHARQKKRK